MTTDSAPPTPSDLVAWAASETAAFYTALSSATAAYASSGVRPKPLLVGAGGAGAGSSALVEAGGKKARAKKDPAAPKRPASAYNVFVKERAAELKEAGFDAKAEHTSLMSKVAEQWKAMSEAEKDKFTADAIARGKAAAPHSGPHAAGAMKAAPAPAAPAAAAPVTPAGGDADDEERRRRKAEKRARKEAAKAAAAAAGGEPAHKKHKHNHA